MNETDLSAAMDGTRQFLARMTRRIDPYLLLLLALSLFAIAPLCAPGYFYTAHDGRHSVFYLSMFDASVRDGAWWPRWAMHHIQGYGYPTFIIQAPMGFYLGEFFVLLGAGYTSAVKLSWAVGFLASGWGMYRLVLHWVAGAESTSPETAGWGSDRTRLAGLVAGLIYVYLPYHFVGIYVRGALNDTLLLAWFPWVMLAFDNLIARGPTPGWTRRVAVAALVLAGTLLTHSFALISFTPLLITFVLFRVLLAWQTDSREAGGLLQRGGLALGAGLLALLLFAVFLVPLLLEGPLLQQEVYSTGTYSYRNHFVYLGQFFSPFWGFGYSDDPLGANDGMGFQVGVLALLLLLTAITQLWRGKPQRRAIMLYLLVAVLSVLLLMTPAAAPLWDGVPLLGVIQFPWRLLSLVALLSAALAGLTVANLLAQLADPSQETGGALLLGLLALFAGYSYIGADLQPVEPWREDGRAIFRFEEEHPDMIAYTNWVEEPFVTSPMTEDYAADEYTDVHGANNTLSRLAVIQDRGDVLSVYSRGSSGGGVVRMDEPGVVRIHLFYFPGWQAYLDGAPVDHRLSNPSGLLAIDVPAGEHRIDVRMEATAARRIGTITSWLTLAVVMGLFFWPSRRTQ